MMRFTKIKWDTKEVLLRWTTEQGGETHDHEVTAKATPHPDFTDALKALRDDVIDICELPTSYATGLRVQSVTMSRSEKTGIEGAVVTALKTLSSASSPLVLNTPYLVDDDEAEVGGMTRAMSERIAALVFEAQRYVEGKRAQGELFGAPSDAEQRANEDADAGEVGLPEGTTATMSLHGGPPEPFDAQKLAGSIRDRFADGRRGRPGSDFD